MGVVNSLISSMNHVNVRHPYINFTIQCVTNDTNPSLCFLIKHTPIIVSIKPGNIQFVHFGKLSKELWLNAILNYTINDKQDLKLFFQKTHNLSWNFQNIYERNKMEE